jgi:dipeptidyl aminopeptidase/acylaminoacyl peptidase
MRASRSRTAGVAASLALLVASPLAVAHVAGAAGSATTGPRPAIAVVGPDGASAMLPDGSGRSAVPWLLPGDTGLAVSPSGRRLAFSSARTGNREIYAVDIATGEVERLTWTPRREDVEPAWSPDDSQVVWASGTESDHDLQAIRIDRTGFRRLTSGPADDREPAWSPDGRTVAFASNEQGAFDLFLIARRGGSRRLLLDASGEARAPEWHPSGTRIAYTGIVGANADVWVAALDGSSQRLIASRRRPATPSSSSETDGACRSWSGRASTPRSHRHGARCSPISTSGRRATWSCGRPAAAGTCSASRRRRTTSVRGPSGCVPGGAPCAGR